MICNRRSLFSVLLCFPVVLCWALGFTRSTATDVASPPSIQIRGDLDHSQNVFVTTEKGRVAFIGGSITEMEGYRVMVMENLRKRFPKTEFTFVNAGIASTCSHTGAFRFSRDVLAVNPDLVFVEFAVNDDQDAAHSYDNAVRGMEGIIRAARSKRPEMDIVMTHFVNPSMLETVQEGDVPTSIRAHELVAQHYDVPTCNVAVELARQIDSGEMTWEIYGGVHPKPAGNRIAANLIEQVFDELSFSAASVKASNSRAKSSTLPEPIDSASFYNGRFLPLDAVVLDSAWTHAEPRWAEIPGSLRGRFDAIKLTTAQTVGAELQLSFTGTAVGLYVLAGPDAGAIEFSIDDGEWQRIDLYHRFSRGLHYPRTVVLRSGLAVQDHRVKIRISENRHPDSKGHAVRILQFVAS